MKRILLLLAALLTLNACIGPEGPEGPRGATGEPGEGTHRAIRDFLVENGTWKPGTDEQGNNPFYYYEFDNFYELTDDVYNNGIVLAYVEFGGNTQQILPAVRHYEGLNDLDEYITWTRTIDYEYSKGRIKFFVTSSDFLEDQPETMRFRVVLMW